VIEQQIDPRIDRRIDKVLLVGMMGAGKSSVGTVLSAKLGWPYLDNDVLLERAAGATAPELLAQQGEPALRRAESQVLTLLLGMPGPIVGGVPGGVVLDGADRDRLREASAHVVWLRASVGVLARRVGGGNGRAWLGDDPAAALRRLATERNDCYEQVADQVVDVDALPVGAIARLVLEAIGAADSQAGA
jgi:shikimate kinase